MEKPLVDNVLTALVLLIETEMRSDSAMRFERAAQMCKQASQLLRMCAIRVRDVPGRPVLGGGFELANEAALDFQVAEALNVGENVGYDVPIRGGMIGAAIRPHRASEDLFREVMSQIEPLMRQFGPKKMSPLEEEIAKLSSIRDSAAKAGHETAKFDAQLGILFSCAESEFMPVSSLTNRIKIKETLDVVIADEQLAVDDPLLLRGREVGEDRQRSLPGDRDAGDGGGAAGDRVAPGGGAQEGLVGEAAGVT